VPRRDDTRLVRSPSGRPSGKEHGPMADLAYAVLLVACFALLVLTLRGLERL
jgi:hypothetical protein